jgi:hypothetical protein
MSGPFRPNDYKKRKYAVSFDGIITISGPIKPEPSDPPDPPDEVVAPTVTTSAVSDITDTTATGNGNVTADGGDTITERGVCWDTSSGPTTSDSKATSAGTTGAFSVSITGLTAETLYYYRAYAINSVGTSYGEELSFTSDVHVFSPSDIADFWYDPADSTVVNGEITKIDDKIGEADLANAVGNQLSYTASGISGLPSLVGAGSNTIWREQAWGTKTGFSVTGVVQTNKLSGENVAFAWYSAPGTDYIFGCVIIDSVFYCCFDGTIYGTFAFANTNQFILSIVYDGTLTGNTNRLKCYIDGESQTLSFTGTVPAISNALNALDVGSRVGGAASWTGLIGDICGAFSAWEDEDREAVEDYFKTKYGIPQVLLYEPMTSNTLPFPQVAWALHDYGESYAARNLFDGNAATLFSTAGGGDIPSVENPYYAGIDLGAETEISFYNITWRGTTNDPTGWVLQGSNDATPGNDALGTWVDLDTQTGVTPGTAATNWKSGYGQVVSGTYRFYRMKATATGGSNLSFNGLLLYGPTGPPVSLYEPMTSNVLPWPQVASATSFYGQGVNETYITWKAFDNDVSTYWWSNATPTAEAPQYLELDLGATEDISHYNIQNPDANPGYVPKSWVFQTSLDGSEWTDQHSVSGDTNITASAYKTTGYGYEIPDGPISGRYVRLKITEQNSSGGTDIAKFLLYGPSGPPVSLYEPMTSNVLPFPQVTWATSEYGGLEVYFLFDGNSTSFYSSTGDAVPSAETPYYVSIDLGVSAPISCYNIRWRTDYDYDPSAWVLQGSNNATIGNDALGTWVDLDTQTGVVPSGDTWLSGYGQVVSGTYRYYRMKITACKRAGWNISFKDLLLFGPSS